MTAPPPTQVETLLQPWPARVGRLCDAALLLVTVVAAALAAADVLGGLGGGVRQGCVLVAVAVAPGWGVLRACRVPASTFTAVAAIAASVAFTMIIGLIAVTRLDWAWEPAFGLVLAVAAVSLTAALVRNR